MPQPEPSVESAGPPVPDDLVEIGVYATVAEGFDHGLVVLAAGRPFWLVPFGADYRLFVEPQAATSVREQLACFDRESSHWPPVQTHEIPAWRFELLAPLWWALVVLAVFFAQCAWPGRWEEAGALDSRAVFDGGEWWRLATALFLHADSGHLVANLASGVFAFAALVTTFGRRRGWLLLLLASLTGNLAIAALNYPGPYRSVGASTAIFAALGLLTGSAIRRIRATRQAPRWREVLVPLAAGLALLGLFGAGGFNVDVGAHAAGFAAGLAWGFVLALPVRQVPAAIGAAQEVTENTK